MLVRRAGPGDVPWLLHELRAFAALHPFGPRIMGADTHVEALLGTLIRDQYVAIAEEDGRPVGVIAGALTAHPFNPDLLVATELVWWVTPHARGSRAGLALLNAFDAWADGAGAALVNFTLEVGSPVREETLGKRGYVLGERQYIRMAS